MQKDKEHQKVKKKKKKKKNSNNTSKFQFGLDIERLKTRAPGLGDWAITPYADVELSFYFISFII